MYLRSAYKQYEQCLNQMRAASKTAPVPSANGKQAEPAIYAMSANDVLACAGLFHFCLALIPPGFRTIVNTLGFDTAAGDFEVGRAEVIQSITENGRLLGDCTSLGGLC